MSGGDPASPVVRHCDPPETCEKVPLLPVIVLRFDRVLAPSSIGRANYALTSKPTSGDLAFKIPRVDPVERTVVIQLDRAMQPGTSYELRVQAADRPADRLAAFDGAPFAGTAVIKLTTTTDATAFPTPSLDPQADDPSVACDVLTRILPANCASGGQASCHTFVGDAGAPDELVPALGLNLASWDSIVGGLPELKKPPTGVDRMAVQAQTEQNPGGPGGETRDFPYGLPNLDRGNSARSYLLYKILKDPRRVGTFTDGKPPPPTHPTMAATEKAEWHARAAAELAAVIPGAPMPYSTLSGPDAGRKGHEFKPLTLPDLRILRAWIDQGLCNCGDKSCPSIGGDASVSLDAPADTGAATDASDGSVGG